ncbi:hypothetical protein [Synechococcus sp. BA-132 BA5]|uniref:hypothetical protein n=1 Tax=Synechococcus sp. BA-132 BA5 TaxID=3110252 RepID=UPI003FCE0CC0
MMLMGSAMVLLMTPGQAFFYGGFSRSRNRLNVMMMSFFPDGAPRCSLGGDRLQPLLRHRLRQPLHRRERHGRHPIG